MSDSYPTIPLADGPDTSSASGKAQQAKDQASDLKDTAASSAADVAGTAKDQAGKVASEAKAQAKDLFSEAQGQLRDQAGTQQKRAASGLRSLGEELGSMASSSSGSSIASDLVGQASDRVGSVASWLESRDPGSLLQEARSYAARKPGTFIAIAAVAGVLAGRLTRNVGEAVAAEKENAAVEQPPVDIEQNLASQPAPAFDYAAPVDTFDATPLATDPTLDGDEYIADEYPVVGTEPRGLYADDLQVDPEYGTLAENDRERGV